MRSDQGALVTDRYSVRGEDSVGGSLASRVILPPEYGCKKCGLLGAFACPARISKRTSSKTPLRTMAVAVLCGIYLTLSRMRKARHFQDVRIVGLAIPRKSAVAAN